MKKWIRKLMFFMLVMILVIGVDSCRHKEKGVSNEDIYKAKDYAVSVFEDTMPKDYTLVNAKGSVGEERKDSIYEITLTYTIGDGDEKFSHWYKVDVQESGCTMLEEKACD